MIPERTKEHDIGMFRSWWAALPLILPIYSFSSLSSFIAVCYLYNQAKSIRGRIIKMLQLLPSLLIVAAVMHFNVPARCFTVARGMLTTSRQ
jgi:hypothetical protein